uniref:Uncharacterized protein n=1 Tax=Oryza brachyantha TaxID=4533 RepID=J3MTH8_ORYBR
MLPDQLYIEHNLIFLITTLQHTGVFVRTKEKVLLVEVQPSNHFVHHYTFSQTPMAAII